MEGSGDEEIEIRIEIRIRIVHHVEPFLRLNCSRGLPSDSVEQRLHTLTCAIMNWVLRNDTHVVRV